MTTTPDEFLQFAKEMGLGRKKPSSLTPLSISNNNHNGSTLTGLSVLSNLCYLIEDIHRLKAENDRLRAHLDLVNQTEKFLLTNKEYHPLLNVKEKKLIRSTISVHKDEGDIDEDKDRRLSPSNSLKDKQNGSLTRTLTPKERQGVDFVNHHEDLSSTSNVEHDQSKVVENNAGSPTLTNWNRVRHAFRFSLRRKLHSPTSPALVHADRTIPSISISLENEDDHQQDSTCDKKKKKRTGLTSEDTDPDDEYLESNGPCRKRELCQNDTITPTNSPNYTSTPEDDNVLRRKASKIAHYRRKLRSKLDTVKRQFSDQTPSSSPRISTGLHGTTFDDIGSGLNHALLSAKLAPAMTKTYQQKMRDWHAMQKSNFLVDYRRQSIVPKIELNNNSIEPSVAAGVNESSVEARVPIQHAPIVAKLITNPISLSPILSQNQRACLVYQWREIMSEEICLRHYNEHVQNTIEKLKQLEADLKSLKTSIFCTNNHEYLLKHQSLATIEQHDRNLFDQQRETVLHRRCRSCQSLVSMPHSWILAVQSAAYSDILDGTAEKTTERAITFNKRFFHQLRHFKHNRQRFEQHVLKDLQSMIDSVKNIPNNRLYSVKPSSQYQTKILLNRGSLRKLPLLLPTEIPQSTKLNSMTTAQSVITKLESFSSHIDHLPTPTNSEPDPSSLQSSSIGLHKHSKRSRFDFKKTLKRSKSICMTQIHSWLQKHRQQQQQKLEPPASFESRRKSATDSKSHKELMTSSISASKLFGSPRLARLHRRIFKSDGSTGLSMSSTLESPPLVENSALPEQTIDDSDKNFYKPEPQVRIYLPARTPSTIHRVRVIDHNISVNKDYKPPPLLKVASPIVCRRNSPSSSTNTANVESMAQ